MSTSTMSIESEQQFLMTLEPNATEPVQEEEPEVMNANGGTPGSENPMPPGG